MPAIEEMLNLYRAGRVRWLQWRGDEPTIAVEARLPLEYHGAPHCGWSLPGSRLGPQSVVVDVGIGEEVSFPLSLIGRYGCDVHGFDPTPRAVQFAAQIGEPKLSVTPLGVSARAGSASFHLPTNTRHVSGSLVDEAHLAGETIQVELIDMDGLRDRVSGKTIDLLKLDIEGAEYELIASDPFVRAAPFIRMLCIEFHHRWSSFGAEATLRAVDQLRELGFACVWISRTSNEEFTFVSRHG